MKGVLLVAGENRIRQLRKELHLTQKQLADKINVSSQVISNWERGYTEIGKEDLKELAKALDCSTDYIIGISDNKEPLYRKAGVSENDYNNLSTYQKEVIDFFVSREKLAFKNKPENILEALEEFEIFYEYWKKKQEDKK